ncbi:MAG: hypothetical protein A2W52_01475 [Candidatus Taylorbacteria bacterium RIFCSPHIGHO2_02_49_25]|uniref:Uncharacterized protein n=1 Tax=Candidatus Taylorbacteria bacterium RIFCSPHIGHO2_02_49_25 TaxID=1802305 RepID=A0A1G2MDE7_9BACT|nr:MAG: hypothetical protein A2W52_01475 [Candidatus Taylorbacteria bacterium RIFCSPHIGHO2_02_49_25]OHA35290.1 MAG: hypothetical protein A2W65_04605 [Candidatus Taylorbacteria bacterium RIFCSPLOWO2_02_50_13]
MMDMKKAVAFAAGAAMFLSAVPAFASDDIDVEVKNKDTTVINTVGTSANTGSNIADGGSASTLVEKSGNVKGSGNDDNSTSAGGNTSLGGFGGVITTGNAKAKSKVSNNVNSTDIKVKTECGCDDDVDVHVKNKRTDVTNDVGTLADTGFNDANGGSADATVTKSGSVKGTDNDANTTSAGDNLSIGGDGGEVTTGNAKAKSKVSNTVNSTVIRVRRI